MSVPASAPAHLAAVVQQTRALAAQGDLRTARDLLDDTLDAATATLGVDHPDVLAANRQLARLHTDLGELADARRVLDEALAAGYFRLGDQHPIMLALAYDLAGIADELGNLYEARRRYGQVARLGPATLGDGHEYVRVARDYLGDAAPPPLPVRHEPPAEPPFGAAAGGADDGTLPNPERVSLDPEAATYQPTIFTPEHHDARPDPPQPVAPPLPVAPPQPVAPPLPVVPPQAVPPQAVPRSGPPARRGRGRLVAVLAVTAIALAGGAAAAIIAFTAAAPERPSGNDRPATANASPIGAPTGVRLRDDGAAVTLTWNDPSQGTVSFIVAGGQDGAGIRPLHTLLPGATTHTVHGLNPRLNYCFTIAAVYDVNRVAVSDLVCTTRISSAAPSRTG